MALAYDASRTCTRRSHALAIQYCPLTGYVTSMVRFIFGRTIRSYIILILVHSFVGEFGYVPWMD